ncbi:hypothetical protein ACHAWC_009062 [Mediolabrus comicus]
MRLRSCSPLPPSSGRSTGSNPGGISSGRGPQNARNQTKPKLPTTRARAVRVLLISAISSMVWFHCQNTPKNYEFDSTHHDDVNSHRDKEKEKFLVNCSSLHSKGNPVNFIHITSDVTGGSDFNMSVHDPEKEVISMGIKEHGCFECDILRSLMSALRDSKSASLIDIGGNIGMYSLHAASHGRNVIAFEPLQINQERFCQSILQNSGFEKKIQIVPRALTNEHLNKYVDFNKGAFDKAVYKRNRGQKNYGTLITGAGLETKPNGVLGKDYALAATIDSMQHLRILPPPGSHVILKVDVEGSECRALSGASEYLHTVNITYVALEMTPERVDQCRSGGVWNEIYNLFLDNGLGPYKFDDQAKDWVKIDNWHDLKIQRMVDIAFSAGTPSNI